MTVKTQGGKVITKDGKVSCECCGFPACCPYPAKAILDSVIFASDLPTQIEIGGTPYSLSGSNYGNSTNGILYESGVWAKYQDGRRSTQPCLLQGNVVDILPDILYISATNNVNPEQSFSNVAMTRTGLCEWESDGPTFAFVEYVSRFYNEFSLGQRDVWRAGFSSIDSTFASSGRLNTPVGTYDNRFNFTNIVIST